MKQQSKNLKVLMLGRYDYKQVVGGVQQYADSILDTASESIDMDAVVSSKNFFDDTRELLSGIMWRVGTIATVASVPISPLMPFRLWQRNSFGQYDIIHFNFPDPLSMICFLFLKKKSKYIVSWHSDVVKQKWALWAYLPLLSLFMSKADTILVATESHIKTSKQFPRGIKAKIKIVPYGIPSVSPTQYNKKPPLIHQHESKKVIFALGRHVYYKGFEYLIKAMSKVDDSVLILGGSGPLTASYKKIICDCNLEGKVFLAGKIPDLEVNSYYKHCSVFCLPSVETSEAFGYVQVEAMRFGKPIVNCALNNGVNEVSPHMISGLTVPPKAPQGLADAINSLLKNPNLYSKLSLGALQRAQMFSLDQFTKNVLNCYYETSNTAHDWDHPEDRPRPQAR